MTVPLWLFAFVTTWAVVITLFHFVRNPLPFPDRGSRIFVCPSVDAQSALLKILAHYGLKPRFRLDTALVKRAILWDGTILNVTDPELYERIGKPAAGLAVVVRHPVLAAREACRCLRQSGFKADVLEDPDPEAPPQSLVFLVSNACAGWVLVFRRHMVKMGPMPPRWQ